MLHIKKFNTLQAADGYVITEPFVTSIADNEMLYCNEPDKKLKLEGGDVIVSNVVADNEILYIATQKIENAFTATAQSNEWNSRNGHGILTFEENVEITIPNNAFDYEQISVVKLGNNVTSIGDDAFSDCHRLTSVTMGNNVTSIGDGAFSHCNNLISVTIPDTVTSIGDSAFSGCSSLTSVIIPNGIRSIENNTFYDCESLTSITIPNSVTNIGMHAFDGCSGLVTATIGSGITNIDVSPFDSCTNLTDLTFLATTPPSIDQYGLGIGSNVEIHVPSGYEITYAEYNECWQSISWQIVGYVSPHTDIIYTSGYDEKIENNFTSSALMHRRRSTDGVYVLSFDNLDWLTHNAFEDETGLLTIELPDEIRCIGDYAFNGCSLLNCVKGDGVEDIGENAFRGCTALTSITIPNSVTDIGDGAFYGCTNLTSVTIPNSVTSIGDYAFSGCSGLTSVTIGAGVTSIGNEAFHCSNQTNLTFTSQTPVSLVNEDTVIYMCGEYPLVDTITVPAGYEETYAVQDAGWEYLAEYIIGLEYTVTPIVIKDSMADGDVTIRNRTYAPKIAVPIAVRIGQDSELSSLSAETTSGTPITVIKEDDTFYYFTMPYSQVTVHANIRYTGQLPEIYYTTTDNNKILNTFTNSAAEHVWDAENNRWILRFSSINDIATIPANAFSGEDRLSSIILPEGVETISDGDYEYLAPFKNCRSLTSVTIPNSVTHIGDYAFLYCNSLSSVTIGNGVTSIGNNAFLVNYVGQSAYHVTIPASVTSIGHDAFCGFSNINLKSTTPISLTDSSGYAIRAFSDIYDGSGSGSGAGEPLKIIVPDQAYDDYINAAETDAGWAYYKDVLVAESSMNQNNV